MSFKHVFVALLSATVLFSCTSTEKNDREENGKKVPMVVNLDFEQTRAVSFPSNTPTSEEYRLTNVAIFVFNNQKLLEAKTSLDAVRLGGFQNSETYAEFEVAVGRHYIYAIANVPKSYLDYTTDGMSMDDFAEGIFSYDLDVLTGGGFFDEVDGSDEQVAQESRGFLMTSKGGYNEFWAVDSDNVADNTTTIEMVRAVAKVAVAFDPANQTDGSLLDVQYLVDNNPQKLYWVEKYNGSALITPNYNHTSITSSEYQAPLHDYQPAIYPTTAAADKTWTYCMENSNRTPKEGNAAVAMIKGYFVPSTLLTADGQSVDSNPDPANGKVTFWRIATVRDGRRTYDDGYYASQPVAALITADKEAVEFVNGECYYPVWLANDQSGNENKYTVKRNSYYKVTITSVTGAGGVDPGDVIDPEIPLDRQVTIGVNITVSNWDDVDQSTGI